MQIIIGIWCFMKRLGIIAIIAAFCVFLTACDSGGEQVTTTAPEVVIQAAKEKNKVSAAREESFEYTDNNGNAYSATYRIPSINFDNDDSEKANEEIVEKYTPDFEKAEKESASRNGLTCDSLNYEKFENKGILSVVIKRVYYSHAVDYSVYNFNSKTGDALSGSDVAKASKLSWDEVTETLRTELEKDYVSKYKTSKPEKYEENLEKTLSDDNLGSAMLYLGKDGKLTAICKEYASVGAGEFSVVLTI